MGGRVEFKKLLESFNPVDMAFIKSLLEAHEIIYYIEGETLWPSGLWWSRPSFGWIRSSGRRHGSSLRIMRAANSGPRSIDDRRD